MTGLPDPSWLLDRVTVEPMRKNDLDQVVAIERKSFPQPWTKCQFASEMDRRPSVCLVARRESDVLGHLIFWLLVPEIHILNIAVKPEMRQKGIGRLLMDYLFAYAQETGVDEIYLEVRPSNEAALALYERVGFVVTGRRPNYYPESKEDALLMTCSLTPPLSPPST